MSTGLKSLALLVGSALYWQSVCWLNGVTEPWDANAYWRLWYPMSFGLSALAGISFKPRGWMAGAILTFAQLPVMWLNTGPSFLWPVGVMATSVLAVPVVGISALTGWCAVRARSG
jgi:hypothetical protein